MKAFLLVLTSLGIASGADSGPSAMAVEENSLKQLLQIRRVYVDHLTGGDTAAQMRDILLSSLESSNLFVLREPNGPRYVEGRGGRPGLHRGAHFVGQFECADECGRGQVQRQFKECLCGLWRG